MKRLDILITENTALKAEVQSLRKQLAQEKQCKCTCKTPATSKNSSKAPSSDFKSDAENPPRKGGARPGHPGHSRKLLPEQRVDQKLTHSLNQCPGCQSTQIIETPEGRPVQTYDLVMGRCIVTEHKRKRYRCRTCQRRFSARLPQMFDSSLFSPSIQAMIGTLTGHFHLSKAQVKNLFQELFEVAISVGSVCKIERRLTSALQPAYHSIKEKVQTTTAPLFVDETSWRNSAKTHFVWLACTKVSSFFHIAPTRSKVARDALLGTSFKGTIITDRYAVYSSLKVPHQYCLAHIKRNLKRFAEGVTDAKWIAQEILANLRYIFIYWRQFQGNSLERSRLKSRVYYRRQKISTLLSIGEQVADDSFATLCKSLIKNFEKLWVFARVAGVEPTNNEAERSLRQIVLYRKKSLGTKSEVGMAFVATISTICQTLRKQGKNILHFITEAMKGNSLCIAG